MEWMNWDDNSQFRRGSYKKETSVVLWFYFVWNRTNSGKGIRNRKFEANTIFECFMYLWLIRWNTVKISNVETATVNLTTKIWLFLYTILFNVNFSVVVSSKLLRYCKLHLKYGRVSILSDLRGCPGYEL